jgi:hypothetical protein
MKSDHGFGKLTNSWALIITWQIGGDKERAQEAGKKGGEASYENGGLTQ